MDNDVGTVDLHDVYWVFRLCSGYLLFHSMRPAMFGIQLWRGGEAGMSWLAAEAFHAFYAFRIRSSGVERMLWVLFVALFYLYLFRCGFYAALEKKQDKRDDLKNMVVVAVAYVLSSCLLHRH